ncbi:hypothetical protein DX980_00105 (plasmid) [Burkholderia gladioli]|uniref:hypothetical protein n=1 Tax=Burkholderia gladioli TaxID=28095 RepID=UPI001364DAB1|nr:hypothetical protein [Burkholderia gladioli]KAF1065522.1 hypothetical protein LvStA_00014 [Burkholderia gladioli]WAG17811.1 hypothetical protein DX980_00105 [Burkholderia gladioli]
MRRLATSTRGPGTLNGLARARRALIAWCRDHGEMGHFLMAATAACVAWGLYQWADGLRVAALRGDVRVRAAREAIRSALHWRDSVSVLEHALGGIGMALVGFAALQFFYFVVSRAGLAVGGDGTRIPWPLRVLIGAPIIALAVAFAWHTAYGRTGPLVVAAVLLVGGWSLAWPDQLLRLALVTPARFIALSGSLFWLHSDLAWKLDQWSTTLDPIGIVLLHLLAGGTTLLGVSAAMGRLTRRVGALRPAGA